MISAPTRTHLATVYTASSLLSFSHVACHTGSHLEKIALECCSSTFSRVASGSHLKGTESDIWYPVTMLVWAIVMLIEICDHYYSDWSFFSPRIYSRFRINTSHCAFLHAMSNWDENENESQDVQSNWDKNRDSSAHDLKLRLEFKKASDVRQRDKRFLDHRRESQGDMVANLEFATPRGTNWNAEPRGPVHVWYHIGLW